MAFVLRIILIIVSFFTTWYVIRKIRKSQIQIGDSIFWIGFSSLLIVLSIFPSIARVASSIIGIMSPANLVFVVTIFLLLLKVFFLTVKLSAIENKFQNFIQEYTLREYNKEIAGKIALKEIAISEDSSIKQNVD
jgi:hypothetical protein